MITGAIHTGVGFFAFSDVIARMLSDGLVNSISHLETINRLDFTERHAALWFTLAGGLMVSLGYVINRAQELHPRKKLPVAVSYLLGGLGLGTVVILPQCGAYCFLAAAGLAYRDRD